MAEFIFPCPRCGENIQCDTGYSGTQITCPACQQSLIVPQAAAIPQPPPRPAAPATGQRFSSPSAARPPAAAKSNQSGINKTILILSVLILTAALGAGGVYFYKWLRNPHRVAAAKRESIIAQHLAEPLGMTGHVQTPASSFKQITQFPWKYVPIGAQVFCNVPLQIDGMNCLYGEGNAKAGLKFPESLTGIPMNQKFETLYVYHGAFYVSPKGTPVYDLVFRYEDGSSATNEILYGDDVLDWYANGGKKVVGPTSERSRLAWHGGVGPGEGKQPLRFCLTAVENPYPAITVTAIDLYSCKSQSAACILAFTPGHAGLMH